MAIHPSGDGAPKPCSVATLIKQSALSTSGDIVEGGIVARVLSDGGNIVVDVNGNDGDDDIDGDDAGKDEGET